MNPGRVRLVFLAIVVLFALQWIPGIRFETYPGLKAPGFSAPGKKVVGKKESIERSRRRATRLPSAGVLLVGFSDGEELPVRPAELVEDPYYKARDRVNWAVMEAALREAGSGELAIQEWLRERLAWRFPGRTVTSLQMQRRDRDGIPQEQTLWTASTEVTSP